MRLLVTRDAGDAERTAGRLAALGHEAVVAPVIAIATTGAPPPAGPWDAVIVTSAHAAPALAELALGSTPVFAVGPRTAAAVRAAGARRVEIAGGDAVSLVDLIRRTQPAGRLLHVAGRHRKAEPEASLRAAGHDLQVWETYEARAQPALPEAARRALAEASLDGVLHYSRRSAAILMRLAEEAGLLDVLLAVPHLCLSPDVAVPFSERSAARVIVAARPEERFLLAAIDTLSRRDRSH